MKKATFGWVLALALAAAGLGASAATVNQNESLRVIGLALHQETSRDIYLGALYIGRQQPTPENLVEAEGPRVMEYRILARRTSVRSLLGKMLLQGELATGANADPVTDQLATAVMSAVQGSLYAGDSLEIELEQGGDTRVLLNGQSLAISEGRSAADFFMAGWIGERGPSTSFRQSMLSGKVSTDLLAVYDSVSLTDERVAEVNSWFEVEESSEEAAPELLDEPMLVAASVTLIPEEPVAGVAEEVTEALADAVVKESDTPQLPQPIEEPVLITEQSTEAPVQVALASPAPVLAPDMPEGVAALDAVEYAQRLAVFQNMLLRKVYANIHYPRSAVRRNLQGKLELDLALNTKGEFLDVQVVNSSGFNVLDEAAIKATRKALKDPLESLDQVAIAEYADGEDRIVIPVPVAFILTE